MSCCQRATGKARRIHKCSWVTEAIFGKWKAHVGRSAFNAQCRPYDVSLIFLKQTVDLPNVLVTERSPIDLLDPGLKEAEEEDGDGTFLLLLRSAATPIGHLQPADCNAGT